jgi:hypothetical protein
MNEYAAARVTTRKREDGVDTTVVVLTSIVESGRPVSPHALIRATFEALNRAGVLFRDDVYVMTADELAFTRVVDRTHLLTPSAS